MDSRPRSSDSIRPGTLLAGKYRVLRTLGEGGMGKVVLARHEALEQDVAIKLLPRALALDAVPVQRFLREAKAAAKLQSDHVVRVTDVGTLQDRRPYIVMEYLRGRDLDQILVANGPLPTTEAVDYVIEALDAVAEAHATGIVHRDLKPSNLFLASRADGSSIIKVLDFGVSKQLAPEAPGDRKLTGDQLSLGTPAFMAPEQLKNAANVDARADIWSIGVVLYELLTAQLPFAGDTVPELLANVLTEDPIPLSTRRGDAPPALEKAIRTCLQRDRDMRYASVAELAEALAPLGSGSRSGEVARIVKLLSSHASKPQFKWGEAVALPEVEGPSAEIDDPTVKMKQRPVLANEPTQRTWRVREPSQPRRFAMVAGAGAGLAVALAVVAVMALRSPRGDGAGEKSSTAARVAASDEPVVRASGSAMASANATATATASASASASASSPDPGALAPVSTVVRPPTVSVTPKPRPGTGPAARTATPIRPATLTP